MPYIPLIEHTRPRILMLDFAQQDVEKIKKAGFDVRRGATGVRGNDQQQFCLPFATQDVEILFAQVQTGSFTSKGISASNESIEDIPAFYSLVREIWEKRGWIVLFICQNTLPEELNTIGIKYIGVINYSNHHIPESLREEVSYVQKNKQIPWAQMPKFRGQGVHIAEEPEAEILKRYVESANMSILTCFSNPFEGYHNFCLEVFGGIVPIEWLIQDISADKNIMALKLEQSVYGGQEGKKNIYNKGGILLLPDFGSKNINIALALLQEVFVQTSPHLFDMPQHSWLENYQPIPVSHLQKTRQSIIEETTQRIKQIDKSIELEREKYAWLLGLLVSKGDQFAVYAAEALRFLGFEVEEIDDTLTQGEQKREDYHIRHKDMDYFAIGEAKTTGGNRGASEDFITKTQTHQSRYSRENNLPSPKALLIINYALGLNPQKRGGSFYKSEIAERLEANAITALNSVALFELCQLVLDEKLSKEQAQQFITSGQPLIVSGTIEEVTNQLRQ